MMKRQSTSSNLSCQVTVMRGLTCEEGPQCHYIQPAAVVSRNTLSLSGHISFAKLVTFKRCVKHGLVFHHVLIIIKYTCWPCLLPPEGVFIGINYYVRILSIKFSDNQAGPDLSLELNVTKITLSLKTIISKIKII